MTNLKQLTTSEKVAYVQNAWTMFLTGFEPADSTDTAAAQMISDSLSARQFTADQAVIDNSKLDTIATWIRTVLRTANEGDRKACTKAAEQAIEMMARKLDRTNPELAKAIRNA